MILRKVNVKRIEALCYENNPKIDVNEFCTKFGVNIYDYLYDRISQKNNLPSLAELIIFKSQMR